MVFMAHPRKEVQPLSAERSDTSHGGTRQHSVSQQRGASQRMRAAGGADRIATVRVEMGKDRGGVGGAVGHGPARLAGGAEIAGRE